MEMGIKRDSALMKAHALIDWERLRPLLSGLYKREASRVGGQKTFDALLMFKAILLGQWHSLSDPKLETALTIRIDFMHFCAQEARVRPIYDANAKISGVVDDLMSGKD